ncbi:hypothetical protein BASA81_011607 [Batrachochytrium salamandrivorans]|nr:hypothetical protein BASA81_011607 [Batrachochytrium salamandrivorans]
MSLPLQMYLSRPGHENPHVPEVLDYIILEDEFILVMEYFDENWMSLSSYVEEKRQLDIDTIRSICREILNGMLSLKRHGVAHDDLHVGNVMYNTQTGGIKLIDFGDIAIFPGWEEGNRSR